MPSDTVHVPSNTLHAQADIVHCTAVSEVQTPKWKHTINRMRCCNTNMHRGGEVVEQHDSFTFTIGLVIRLEQHEGGEGSGLNPRWYGLFNPQPSASVNLTC